MGRQVADEAGRILRTRGGEPIDAAYESVSDTVIPARRRDGPANHAIAEPYFGIVPLPVAR